jgi:hypothetical protein
MTAPRHSCALSPATGLRRRRPVNCRVLTPPVWKRKLSTPGTLFPMDCGDGRLSRVGCALLGSALFSFGCADKTKPSLDPDFCQHLGSPESEDGYTILGYPSQSVPERGQWFWAGHYKGTEYLVEFSFPMEYVGFEGPGPPSTCEDVGPIDITVRDYLSPGDVFIHARAESDDSESEWCYFEGDSGTVNVSIDWVPQDQCARGDMRFGFRDVVATPRGDCRQDVTTIELNCDFQYTDINFYHIQITRMK